MKRTLSVILAVLVLASVMLTLVSCGGPSGTYDGALFDLKFKGDNATVIVGEGDNAKELKGTYEITENDDGKQYISFDFIDESEATDDQKAVLDVIEKIIGTKVTYEETDDGIKIGLFSFKKK